jgi:hypothetical protein
MRAQRHKRRPLVRYRERAALRILQASDFGAEALDLGAQMPDANAGRRARLWLNRGEWRRC